LKAFFTVAGKGPVEVTAADVFDFLAHQRGDRAVVRLADRESGLSARMIARRLSSVSGLFAYLVARGERAGAGQPGATGAADPPPGRDGAVADGAAGAGAAHPAADLGARRGGPAGGRAAHAPGPGDGAEHAAGRVAPL
jgi:hypothetical protein